MVLKSSHLVVFLFFSRGTNTLFLKSDGHTPSSSIFLHSLINWFNGSPSKACRNSAGMPSRPSAFFLHNLPLASILLVINPGLRASPSTLDSSSSSKLTDLF